VSVRPLTPEALAALLADTAVAVRSATASGRARLAVDGPVPADCSALADAVGLELTERAVPVARVRAEDWLRSRSLRLESGADDPAAYLERWFDVGALRREVLDPFGTQGHASWLPRLRDPVTDRSVRDPRRPVPRGAVAVLDVPFLARWQTRGAVDVLVHLDVSPAARARRVPIADHARVLPAWEDYLATFEPAQAAAVIVRYDRPGSPAVVLAGG
jgi:hypothetical protein